MSGLFDLSGSTALVVGGGSGLGEAMALGLAEAGAHVVVTGRNAVKLINTVNKIKDNEGAATSYVIDILNTESVDTTVDVIAKKFGSIDILVNSAGVHLKKPTIEVSDDEWDTVIETNLTGTFRVARAVARKMIERKRGKIINIASLGSSVALKDAAAYTASKAGVVLLTKNLAVELAQYNIQVNAIAPGVFKTALNEKVLVGERLERIISNTPMKRLGSTEEIAGTAVYLASKASDFVTGSVITIDGGFLAWGI